MRPEAEAQAAVFDWAAMLVGQIPELELLHSSIYGAVLAGGKGERARQVAALKRQGMRPGLPDMCLPVARGGYHGLYIELKVGKGKPTPLQRRWARVLKEQGYCVELCFGIEETIAAVSNYLTLGA